MSSRENRGSCEESAAAVLAATASNRCRCWLLSPCAVIRKAWLLKGCQFKVRGVRQLRMGSLLAPIDIVKKMKKKCHSQFEHFQYSFVHHPSLYFSQPLSFVLALICWTKRICSEAVEIAAEIFVTSVVTCCHSYFLRQFLKFAGCKKKSHPILKHVNFAPLVHHQKPRIWKSETVELFNSNLSIARKFLI